MYRHASYFNCTRCGRSVSRDQAEFDPQGRYICTPCNTVARVDATMARWRHDARSNRWLKLAGAALVVAAFALFPKLILVGTAKTTPEVKRDIVRP